MDGFKVGVKGWRTWGLTTHGFFKYSGLVLPRFLVTVEDSRFSFWPPCCPEDLCQSRLAKRGLLGCVSLNIRKCSPKTLNRLDFCLKLPRRDTILDLGIRDLHDLFLSHQEWLLGRKKMHPLLPPLTKRRSAGLDLGLWFRFMVVGFSDLLQRLISHRVHLHLCDRKQNLFIQRLAAVGVAMCWR